MKSDERFWVNSDDSEARGGSSGDQELCGFSAAVLASSVIVELSVCSFVSSFAKILRSI